MKVEILVNDFVKTLMVFQIGGRLLRDEIQFRSIVAPWYEILLCFNYIVLFVYDNIVAGKYLVVIEIVVIFFLASRYFSYMAGWAEGTWVPSVEILYSH